MHAFQGRTVDNVIAVMEANHPHLTTQKSFYVEISSARDRAELVADNAQELREHLETATGERVSALEGIGIERDSTLERECIGGQNREITADTSKGKSDRQPGVELDRTPEPKRIEHDLGL